jgi:Holliday junction resolvase RusA-like endonuclease
MTMYPAEWPYRAAEAYDHVCGGNIAIDTDDLVLAGSHMVVVIGTYGRRGDGVDGVNWEKVMRERRFYHVSWEEYLLIVQFVLAKKFSFNNAIDTLLKLTDDMTEINKKKIGKWKTTRPDTDNLIKALKDTMTDLGFWDDDSQVADERVRKKWTTKERAGVTIVIDTLKEREDIENE